MITYAQKAKGANTVPQSQQQQQSQQAQQQQLLRQHQQQRQQQQQQSAAQQINARSQQQQQMNAGQPRFQMTQLLPPSMTQLYGQYPYNYAIQQQQQQQQQQAMQQQQQQRSKYGGYQQQAPRGGPGPGTGTGQDQFFDRRLNQYYQSQNQNQNQNPNRYQTPNPNPNPNQNSNYQQRSNYNPSRGRGGRSSRFGGHGNNGYNNQYNGGMQKPSYSSTSRSHSSQSQSHANQSSYDNRGGRSYRRDRERERDSVAYHGRSKQPRGKPTAAQLRTYQTVADRDVLCWIFENHGRCRYGEKCQWLHLDRVTGQYVPTVYIMNSMDGNYPSVKTKGKEKDKDNVKSAESDSASPQTTSGDNKEDVADKEEKEKEADQKQEEEEEEEDLAATLELAEKFKKMMAKQIEDRLKEEEEKKNQPEPEPEPEPQAVANDVNQDQEENKAVEVAEAAKYASYGTTFDKQNVCWEFNTFVGCRKGSSCKWAHQYLMKGATHPYTGEKLDGMAVKEFRKRITFNPHLSVKSDC